MTKRKPIFNFLVLTASGFAAKTLDFSFRAYYSAALGEEGMGIFSLIMSAFGIILSLSSAGMGAAVSRLASIELQRGNDKKARSAANTAIFTVLAAGTVIMAAVWLFSEEISAAYLNDVRCASGLCRIAPSAIFMGISYCVKGYFYAKRRVLIPASSEFVEQAVKISVISLWLKKSLPCGTPSAVCAVMSGLCVGEMCSCVYLLVWYRLSKKERSARECPLKELLCQTFPMTVSAVGGSYFRMQEDVWVIRGFKKYGMGSTLALSEYGLLQGMAMPLLTFPLTLLSSFMALMVPETARAAQSGRLGRTVLKIFRVAWFFGCMIFCVFFLCADTLSEAVYGSAAAAKYVRPLCVLCPIMVIDSIFSGMLGGLGKTATLLKYSLSDSLLRLLAVWLILPRGGGAAMVAIIFLSNIFTCVLSTRKIKKEASLANNFLKEALPSLFAATALLAVFSAFSPQITSAGGLFAFAVLVAAAFSAIGIVFSKREKLCLWKFHS